MKRLVTFLARSTSLIGAFVAIAVVMGLIAAGLAAPLVGAVGTAARGGVTMFEQLPGDLEQNPLAEQSRILAADGSLLSTPADENRIVVPIEDISKHMQNAQVAIEDERFYDHGGMDLQGTARALVSNQMNDDVQGGSTLTQQYVKLILLEQSKGDSEAQQALSARSGVDGYIRKLRELRYAVGLEQKQSKDEILEGYLNLVFYGQGNYGVEAAARYYFNTSAKDLTVTQSATLAGIVRSPSNTDPVTNPEAAKSRRNLVLGIMFDLGMIDEEVYDRAVASDLRLDITQSQRSCQSSSAPYFCSYVEAWLLQQDALGDTYDERLQRLTRGGLTVETTLDPELSADINEVTRDWVPPGNEYELYSAAAMVEPGTGHVLAFGQSTTYDVDENADDPTRTSVNWSVDPLYGGGDTRFAIGSIAKAYALVDALEQGMPIDTTLEVPRTERWDVNAELPVSEVEGRVGSDVSERVVFEQDQFQPECTTGSQFWGVRNAEGANYDTRWPLREATAFSVNTAFAQLASEVGTCNIRDTMEDMGLTNAAGEPYGTYAPDYVLGSDSASPLTVAASYATFAAGGLYCEPVPVLRILDSNGEEIPLEEVECRQAIDPDIAAGAVELMTGVIDPDGSGFRAILDGDRPAAGKTGTNDPSTSTWFAGFTPQLSTAVWVGKPDSPTPVTEMRDLQLGDRRVEGYLYGSKFAAPLWKTLMDRALDGEPVEQFEQPSTAIVEGEDAQVPSLRGLTREEAEQALSEAGFQMQIHEYTYRSQLPEGQVVQSRPSQGTTQQTGTSVTVYLAGDGSSYEGPGATDAGGGQESDTESDDD